MRTQKVSVRKGKSNSHPSDQFQYDHYIAVDWSKDRMAIARLKPRWKEPVVTEHEADISFLRTMIRDLRGHRILTIEESCQAHWLYVELHDEVEAIVICDPYRNRLLSDGPKTDKIDAAKLCVLLRGGLLRSVFHSLDETYRLRRLVSAYEDLVTAGVRLQNQFQAFQRSTAESPDALMQFITARQHGDIEHYRESKKAYEEQFALAVERQQEVGHLTTVPGIGAIGAVKIVATVVDVRRFPSPGHFLAYAGLVMHRRQSGTREYGVRRGRYSRRLKSVYKTAAANVLQHDEVGRAYYDRLCARGEAPHHARNAVARWIARVTYGMLKTGTAYHAPTEKSVTKQ